MKRYRFVFLLLAVVAATSCVYDYQPQIDGEGGYLIVEGNIVIGGQTEISTSWSWSLVDTTQTDDRWRILASNKMHIEASDGTRYENRNAAAGSGYYGGYYGGGSRGVFDLREADPSLEYRLVIENEKGTYVSSWASPLPPGQIDSLSYRISEDKTTMSILVAAHSDNTRDSYYRWTVEEKWEYHADIRSLYKYVEEHGQGNIVPLEEGESLYYCWSSGRRPEIMTGTTQGLAEDRLADYQLYTVGNHDARMSIVYRADVRQMRIPEEAWRYWQVMKRNSEDVGGLFSPEPSELRGNIVCLERPDELVLGYVGVMSVTTERLYIKSYEARFYKAPRTVLPTPDTLNSPSEWRKAFQNGWGPADIVWDESGSRIIGYDWWPMYCLDCRTKGGTKNRPADWPNSDY
ncbi:MAG: DUF4249 domain-containing protein [Bacteroidales bacterium]|nr:DUF4249 domain-containing protein [Bacteroidales bacterium]